MTARSISSARKWNCRRQSSGECLIVAGGTSDRFGELLESVGKVATVDHPLSMPYQHFDVYLGPLPEVRHAGVRCATQDRARWNPSRFSSVQGRTRKRLLFFPSGRMGTNSGWVERRSVRAKRVAVRRTSSRLRAGNSSERYTGRNEFASPNYGATRDQRRARAYSTVSRRNGKPFPCQHPETNDIVKVQRHAKSTCE